jgi:MFS family permease
MRQARSGLWAHADFLKLWGAQAISLAGSQVGGLAVSLTAALALGATAGQVGLLRAAAFAPPLFFSLAAGAWADRARRRPLLIATDLGNALLLLSIPLAALLGVLRIEQLYVVNFLAGALANLFQVAYGAFLPAIVGRERLVEANGKLELSRSAAQIGGPGLGGALVGLLTAPVAVVVDALSFLASALLLGLIRQPEPPAPSIAARQGVVADIREGLRLVGGDPLLRALAGSTGTGNFFATISGTALVLFMARDLGLAPAAIGLVVGAIGPGSLLGALLAPRLPARLGLGRTVVVMVFLLHGGNLLQAFAGGSTVRAAATLALAQFAIGLTAVILNVNLLSLSQALVPDRLQGRLRATLLFVSAGAMPLGALAGGALGDALGLRSALLVGGLGGFTGALWIVLSPIRTLRAQPAAARGDGDERRTLE